MTLRVVLNDWFCFKFFKVSMMLIGFDGVKLNCGNYCDVGVFHVWLVSQERTTESRETTSDKRPRGRAAWCEEKRANPRNAPKRNRKSEMEGGASGPPERPSL